MIQSKRKGEMHADYQKQLRFLTSHNVLYSEAEFVRTALRYWQKTAHPLCHLSNLCRGHDPRIRRHRGLNPKILRNIRVRQKMRLQVAPLIEAPTTYRAFVRRLLHMHDFMNRQSPTLAKPLAALVAFERLLLTVYISKM